MIHSDAPVGPVLEPGFRLDRYELLCPIAEGGMAAVWLAYQHGKHGFRRLVAMKTILAKHATEPRFREMFLDEASVSSRIEHPNVVKVLDVGEQRGVIYLVMDWVDGDSLLKLERVVMKKSLTLPDEILLRILSDACLGLHAAHEVTDDTGTTLGVVHRDVSPQNILVNTLGITSVIDFGIAKVRDRLAKETTAGIVKGKLSYMAPEQALGLPVDRRADVWAIGAVFYRIVKGKAPYEASNPMATMDLLRGGRLADPLSTTPGIHPAICEVMEAALCPTVEGRIESAAALRDALERAMMKAGIGADTNDVKDYVTKHLGERIVARKRAIRSAVDLASARATSAPQLKRPPLDSVGIRAMLDPTPTSGVEKASTTRDLSRRAYSMAEIYAAVGGIAPSSVVTVTPRKGPSSPSAETSETTAKLGSENHPPPSSQSRMRVGAIVAATTLAILAAIAIGRSERMSKLHISNVLTTAHGNPSGGATATGNNAPPSNNRAFSPSSSTNFAVGSSAKLRPESPSAVRATGTVMVAGRSASEEDGI